MRMPNVKAISAAAAATTRRTWSRFIRALLVEAGFAFSRASDSSSVTCSAATCSLPSARLTSSWAWRQSSRAFDRASRPRAVALTTRLRASAPGAISTSPASASGFRLRVSVVRSISTSAGKGRHGRRTDAHQMSEERVLRHAQPRGCKARVVVLRDPPRQLAQAVAGAAGGRLRDGHRGAQTVYMHAYISAYAPILARAHPTQASSGRFRSKRRCCPPAPSAPG